MLVFYILPINQSEENSGIAKSSIEIEAIETVFCSLWKKF